MRGLGDLPDAALTVGLRPDALARGFEAFEGRLGLDADALGPLGTAWRRARQGAADVLGELAGPSPAPDLAADWGIVGAEAVQITVAAPEAAALGFQALLARLPGEAGRPAARRRRAGPGDVHDRRSRPPGHQPGAAGEPRRGRDAPAWRGPAPTAWLGTPASGPRCGWWAATRDGDLGGPADPRIPGDRGRHRPAEAGARAARPRRPGRAGARTPAGGGGPGRPARSGAAGGPRGPLDAHIGLRHPDATIREAAGDVLATCTARWADVAEQAWQIDASLALADGLPALTVEARLTEAGTSAWRRDARPLPLPSVPAPLGWQVGWAAPDDAPGPAWIDDTAACGAGHRCWRPWPRCLPCRGCCRPRPGRPVEPPGGFGLARADGAAEHRGRVAGPGGAIPHLVGALRGEEHPRTGRGRRRRGQPALRDAGRGARDARLAAAPGGPGAGALRARRGR
ncbi:MAG: hypothetical protein R3F43_06105 [bacterium]